MSLLGEELLNDPNTLGYSGLSDKDTSLAINLANISRIKATMQGREILEAQDSAEFVALTESKKSQWIALCSIDSIDPSGQVVEIVKDIWGVGSATLSNLSTARNELVSRATELGLGVVTTGQIQAERN